MRQSGGSSSSHARRFGLRVSMRKCTVPYRTDSPSRQDWDGQISGKATTSPASCRVFLLVSSLPLPSCSCMQGTRNHKSEEAVLNRQKRLGSATLRGSEANWQAPLPRTQAPSCQKTLKPLMVFLAMEDNMAVAQRPSRTQPSSMQSCCRMHRRLALHG